MVHLEDVLGKRGVQLQIVYYVKEMYVTYWVCTMQKKCTIVEDVLCKRGVQYKYSIYYVKEVFGTCRACTI